MLWRIFATTRVRPCSFLATILNFNLPPWTPLILTSSHLAPRFFVTRSFSETASVRAPEVSVKPVASKELPLLGQVSATCTVSAFGETVTVSGSLEPTVAKLSATVVAGAAAGPARGAGADGCGSGSGGAARTVVVQLAVAPVETSTRFVAAPDLPVGLTDSGIVRVRWSSVK